MGKTPLDGGQKRHGTRSSTGTEKGDGVGSLVFDVKDFWLKDNGQTIFMCV